MIFSYSSADYIQHINWKEYRNTGFLSKFDEELGAKWDKKMSEGRFKYPISDLKSRIVPGKMQYLVQLNEKRAIERRTPELIESMRKPFNPDGFNFTKVKQDEILFLLCPDNESNDREAENESSSNGLQDVKTGGEIIDDGLVKIDSMLVANGSANGRESAGNDFDNLRIHAVKKNTWNSSAEKTSGRHLLLINISPLEYGHVLLVPDVDDCIPQRITLNGMKLAVDLLLLSAHPGWRVGFNSLCGMASVNHQHVHAWYNDQSLTIETAKVDKVCDNLFELTSDHPTKGFVFHLHGNTVSQFVSHIYKAVNYLQENEIAHNFFLTRGTRLDSSSATPGDELTTARAYVWPRKSQTVDIIIFDPTKEKPSIEKNNSDLKTYSAASQVFNIAVAELGGYVPVYVAESYNDIDEDYISSRLSAEMLPAQDFETVRNDIARLITDP